MNNNPFDRGYYDEHELRSFGFREVGDNVRVAKDCTIIGLSRISFGNNVRIDSHVSLMAPAGGYIDIGSYIHIGGVCYLGGAAGITLEDFAGLSQGVRIYSASDDYSGASLTNPTVPRDFVTVKSGPVHIGRHVIVGSGSMILPGVTIGEGSSMGALSMATKSLEPWGIYSGVPARRIKARSQKLLDLEAEMLNSMAT